MQSNTTHNGLAFDEWRKALERKLSELSLALTCAEGQLYKLWEGSQSTGYVVKHHTIPRASNIPTEQGVSVIKWAQAQAPSKAGISDDKSHGFASHAPLEEKIADENCPIDVRIQYAWENVRIKRGQLGHAEHYASEKNYTEEHERVTEQIAFLSAYLDRLRFTHEHSVEIQQRLADECVVTEQVHKQLCDQREAKRAELERQRLIRAGKPVAVTAPKAPRKLSRDEVLKKYNITPEVLESFRLSGQDPEALISRMMGV